MSGKFVREQTVSKRKVKQGSQLQHSTNNRASAKSTVVESSKIQLDIKKTTGRNRELKRRLCRWVILSSVCIISDFGSALVVYLFQFHYFEGHSYQIIYIWHDISITINIFCMILCFTDWYYILLPFRYIFRKNIVPSYGKRPAD